MGESPQGDFMHAKKLGSILALMAAFGFTACDDSGSSSSNETSCKVTSLEPLVIEMVNEGIKTITTFKFEGGKIIETIKVDYYVSEDICQQLQEQYPLRDIKCNKNIVTTTSKDDFNESDFEISKNQAISSCKAKN